MRSRISPSPRPIIVEGGAGRSLRFLGCRACARDTAGGSSLTRDAPLPLGGAPRLRLPAATPLPAPPPLLAPPASPSSSSPSSSSPSSPPPSSFPSRKAVDWNLWHPPSFSDVVQHMALPKASQNPTTRNQPEHPPCSKIRQPYFLQRAAPFGTPQSPTQHKLGREGKSLASAEAGVAAEHAAAALLAAAAFWHFPR